MSKYTIPRAIDTTTNQTISIQKAVSNVPRGTYVCEVNSCKLDIYVATSRTGKRHFKHYPNSKGHKCNSPKSQDRHTRAKHLIRDTLINAIEHRAAMPRLIFETPNKTHEVLPFFFKVYIKCEHLIKIQINEFEQKDFYIDVAVLDEHQNPLLLIEVKDTHPVSQNKANALKNYWWIEVNAKEVLNNPAQFNVVRHANFPSDYEIGNQKELCFN